MARAWVGMSGWTYAPWRGEFYPKGLRQADELDYASHHVSSIEINGSFYALQKPSSWISWREGTPDGFLFSVKAPRFITHIKRLEDVAEPVANFFASGPLALGPKLGPILWQLPPSVDYDPELVEAFLALLPHTTTEAAELAERRDRDRMAGKEHLETDAERPVRHAIEVRSHSFDEQRFADQLQEHGVACVLGDSAGRWPRLDWITTDFAYARLQGAPGKESYSPEERDVRAGWLKAWSEGEGAGGAPVISASNVLPGDRDVFAFFVSTDKENAPHNARAVMATLGLKGPGE